MECLAHILCLFLLDPDHVIILRGNHEGKAMRIWVWLTDAPRHRIE